MATQIRPRMTDETGVRFGIATGVVVVTVLIASLAGLGEIDAAILLLSVTGLAAVSLRPVLAPILGVIAWAFWTGFVENTLGHLTVAGPDLARLAGFAAITAVLAYGVRNAIVAEAGMNDLTYVALTIVFFVIALLILKGADRL